MSKALAKLLEPFRSKENPAQLATVIDSPDAIRVIAAWTATRRAWKKAKGKPPKTLELLWSWLWRGVAFDRDTLAETSRLASDQAHYVLRALVAARIVYPDGTITQYAEELIDGYVEKRMKQHGRPTTSAKGKPPECPTCGAEAGRPCRMKNGNEYKTTFQHKARESDK